MAQTFFRTTTIEDGRTEVTAKIGIVTWGELRTYTNPGCGPEVEVLQAWLTCEEDDADALDIMGALTDAEIEKIETEFLEDPPEPDYGDDH